MDFYEYLPLDSGNQEFRLIRLFRAGSLNIECEVFHASLSSKDRPQYEALSYTWGDTSKVERLRVNGKTLCITDNLFAALQYLRLPDKDRILWIDAICINQDDRIEQGLQVQQMRKIFNEAETVLVWLGKATYEIDLLMISLTQLYRQGNATRPRTREEWKSLWLSSLPSNKLERDALIRQASGALQMLLARPWFRRVWIIQEVANARTARVIAGANSVTAEIFALAPCLLHIQPADSVQPVLDLMLRSSEHGSSHSQNSNLSALMTRFRSSLATDERDKVNALLSLASDIQIDGALAPDYTKPVSDVVHNALNYLIETGKTSAADILDILASFKSITTICFAFCIRENIEWPEELPEISCLPIYWSALSTASLKNSQDMLEVELDSRSFVIELGLPDWVDPKSGSGTVFSQMEFHTVTDAASSERFVPGSKRPPPVEIVPWRDKHSNVKVMCFTASGKRGVKQLHWAVQKQLNFPVRMLLRRGISISGRTEYTLRAAARRGDLAMVQCLVEEGATDGPTTSYKSVIVSAATYGHEHCVRYLIDGVIKKSGRFQNSANKAPALSVQNPLPESYYERQLCALMEAIERGDLSTAKRLFEEGVTLDCSSEATARLPPELTVRYSSLDMIRLLHENRSKILGYAKSYFTENEYYPYIRTRQAALEDEQREDELDESARDKVEFKEDFHSSPKKSLETNAEIVVAANEILRILGEMAEKEERERGDRGETKRAA